jgi:hypothetical protein
VHTSQARSGNPTFWAEAPALMEAWGEQPARFRTAFAVRLRWKSICPRDKRDKFVPGTNGAWVVTEDKKKGA